MRVLIELFDREPIENVLGPCIFRPDVVVYLCDERDTEFLKESAIYRLFKRRKIKTQPRFYYFDSTDPVGVRRILQAVVQDYPGCVFDFSGGRDLMLLVAGTCFAEMDMPGFFIDISQGRFVNLRGCAGWEERFAMPDFSAEDIFALTGATVHGYGHFPTQQLAADFEEDVLAVFDIVLKNPRAWGEFVAWLQGVCSGTPAGVLHVEGARRRKGGSRGQVRANPVLLQHLKDAGVFTRLDLSRQRVEMTFKSALHRKCLLIEGIWLELYCYVLARRSGFFGDVRTSVVVDWDGVNGGNDNAKNEVDVFLVRGVTPLFISCKMSLPSPLALSEIKLLAGKFGGRRSRAVLLTAGRLGQEHKALQARAADLGITLLDREVLEQGRLQEVLMRLATPRQLEQKPLLFNAQMLPGQPVASPAPPPQTAAKDIPVAGCPVPAAGTKLLAMPASAAPGNQDNNHI